MSDRKKLLGRGSSKRSYGPWARSKKLDEDEKFVRSPKKEDEGLDLSEKSFPPLPGSLPGQFEDDAANSGPSLEEKSMPAPQANGDNTNENGQVEPMPSPDENLKPTTPYPNGDNSIKSQFDDEANTELSNEGNSMPDSANTESSNEGNLMPDSANTTSNEGNPMPDSANTESSNEGNSMPDSANTTYNEGNPMPDSANTESSNEGNLMLDSVNTKTFNEGNPMPAGSQKNGDKTGLPEDDAVNNEPSRDENSMPVGPRANGDIKNNIATNSNLSPFAEEFIPRRLNPYAQQFIQSSLEHDDAENNNPKGPSTDEKTAKLDHLHDTVSFFHTKISEKPADFHDVADVVTPYLMKIMKYPDMPLEIVKHFYSYVLQDAKFSYFAIKLLIHLSNQSSNEDSDPIRDSLLACMEEEMNKIVDTSLNDSNTDLKKDVVPFLMCLSELYVQLEVGGHRLDLVGESILDFLSRLLQTSNFPLKERLECIVVIMKLTGLVLEEDCSQRLGALCMELQTILEQEGSNLDPDTFQTVNGLLILRSLNWGLATQHGDFVQSDNGIPLSPNGNHMFFPQVSTSEANYDPNMLYNEGVFYGPDGHPINYEEQMFLEIETTSLHYLQIEDPEQISPNIEGFDEAYEEFLQTVPGYMQLPEGWE